MPDFLRFRVRLLDVEADLWRTFLLKKAATFYDLHMAIQDACGWENYHLWSFYDGDPRNAIAGAPDEFDPSANEPDARKVKLAKYFPRKSSIVYWYDFGDSWMHEVTLEGIETHPQRWIRRLLDGAGSFPREDCGGVPGYEHCVAVATGGKWDPAFGDEEDREDFVKWLDGWKPDSFDLEGVRREFNM